MIELGKAHSWDPGFTMTSACRTRGQHFLIKQTLPVALSVSSVLVFSPLFAVRKPEWCPCYCWLPSAKGAPTGLLAQAASAQVFLWKKKKKVSACLFWEQTQRVTQALQAEPTEWVGHEMKVCEPQRQALKHATEQAFIWLKTKSSQSLFQITALVRAKTLNWRGLRAQDATCYSSQYY